MDKRSPRKPLALVLSLLVAAIALVVVPSTPAYAVSYWTFKNSETGGCLTAGEKDPGTLTGKAYAAPCTTSTRQDWYWDGNGGYDRLKNRSTGLCLMTDEKNTVNAVWTSACSSSYGQNFRFEYLYGGDGEIWPLAHASNGRSALRTSPGNHAAVYHDMNGFGDLWTRLI